MSEPGSPVSPQLRPPWSRSDRAVPRRLVRPLQEFLETSTASGVLLLGAVAVALVWANSPWRASYEHLWHTPASLHLGSIEIGHDLRFWVNEGLLTFFFLLVGMEIKREVTIGELRERRAAMMPIIAGIGGLLVPALIYLAIAGGEASRGWGVPMTTDIAFALAALSLAAAYAPQALEPMLLTLAIVDDVGAIVVVAIFYSDGLSWLPVLAALLIVGVLLVLERAHVRAMWVYAGLGVLLWYAAYRAGVPPTISGVVLGVLVPAVAFQRPAAVSREAIRTAEQTVDDPDPPDVDAPSWLRLATLSREAISPLARVEHSLLPWSSFVIVPLFALANAGVRLSWTSMHAAATGVVGLGVFLGLVVGKPLGITLAGLGTERTRLGRLPAGVGWADVASMGMTAGIGFTMSLFIADLAFGGHGALLNQAKVAILAASVVAGSLGHIALRIVGNRRTADPK